MAKIHKNDIGTKISLDAGINISGASSLKIKYEKPNGVEGEWLATLEGNNGASYTIKAGDLDVVGTWRIQLYVVLSDWSGYGDKVSFRIYDILGD